jgi:hypothetical protein
MHGAGQTLCQALRFASATTLASTAPTSINTITRSRLSTQNMSLYSQLPGAIARKHAVTSVNSMLR